MIKYKTMKFIKFIAVLGMVFIGTNCKLEDRGAEMFEEGVSRYIGYSIKIWENSNTPPVKVMPLSGGWKEYHFNSPKGCMWAYRVSPNGVIESWRYIGDRHPCEKRAAWTPQ